MNRRVLSCGAYLVQERVSSIQGGKTEGGLDFSLEPQSGSSSSLGADHPGVTFRSSQEEEKQREDRWRKDREKQKKEVRQFHANIATHVNCRKWWGMCRKMPTLNVFVSRTTCLCSWPGLHMGYLQIAAGASGAITAAWLHGVFFFWLGGGTQLSG